VKKKQDFVGSLQIQFHKAKVFYGKNRNLNAKQKKTKQNANSFLF